MAEARVRGFSVATKCATVEEVIEKYRDRVDEQSILVNASDSRELGTECAFAILLADKRVALAGTCVIQNVYTDGNNPFKRPGMRLQIKRLGPESQRVFAELVAKRIPPRRMTTTIPMLTTDAPAPLAVTRTATQPMHSLSTKATGAARTKTQALPTLAVPRTATKPLRAESPGVDVARDVTPPRRMPTVQIPPRDASDGTNEPLGRAPRATPFVPGEVIDGIAAKPTRKPDTNAPFAVAAEGSVDGAPAIELGPEPTEPTLVPDAPKRAIGFARGSELEVEGEPASPHIVPASQPSVGTKLTPMVGRASDPALPRTTTRARVKSEPAAIRMKSEPTTRAKSEPAETRTPGSEIVLPANPLMNLTDASLEGLVDCRLFESHTGGAALADEPLDDARGGLEPSEPARPGPHLRLVPPVDAAAAAPPPPAAARASEPVMLRSKDGATTRDGAVVAPLEPMRSEPMPLPPPPAARPTASVQAQVDAGAYAKSALPDLNVEGAQDRVSAPLISRRTRNRLIAVCTIVPLLGAAAVVVYMQLKVPPPAAAPLHPAETVGTDEPDRATTPIGPAPELAAPNATIATAAPTTQAPTPAVRQPIHAVLVRTSPIAAKVTVGGRSFGTTPTYVKIPANTPVELKIVRPGFKPVTYPLISKTTIDRVFVRLQRTRGGN